MVHLFQGTTIRLTSFRADDVEAITEWYNDGEFMRLFDATTAFPRTQGKWQKWYEGLAEAKDEYNFAIRPLDSNTLIGWLSLDGILWNNRTGWIGLAIGDPAYRGKGYGYEAMQLLLRFGFHEINLHRVQLTVFSYNTPAIRLYQKLGFVHEGTQREFLHRDGERHDLLFYGLLQSEWAISGRH
jgi:RimJ/RimL family protein N-acetyltransferase